MTSDHASRNSGVSAPVPRRLGLIIALCSLLCLVPLFVCWPQFRQLFFFHDDWEMLDGATRLGLGPWLAQSFLGESFFPLFKLLWLGAVHLTGGSYSAMILLLWMTHLAICLLFGTLLARFGMPPAAIVFAVLTFGISWTNLETLGWSTQWNALLAFFFFLAAWHFLLGAGALGGYGVACFLCLLASAFCCARGITSGLVLGIFVLVCKQEKGRVRLLLLCLTPTILAGALTWLLSSTHEVALSAAVLYGLNYLLLNPLRLAAPFGGTAFAPALWIYGTIKAAVFFMAFRKAGPTLRPVLWTLLALDLIMAGGLGYSRWPTGLATATSSRYQYISLFCFTPMAGILVAHLRSEVRVAVTVLCVCGLFIPWKRHAEQWSTSRGIQLRAAILHNDAAAHFDPSSITAGRARELIGRYGLK